MSELLREIEEDIRAERTQRLWQKFGKSMVWVSVAVIAGTAGGVLWRDWQESVSTTRTSMLFAGIEQLRSGNSQKAISQFEKVSAEGGGAHYGIALLHKAQAEEAAGNKEAAEKTLQTLAAAKGSDELAPFADLARLKLGDTSHPIDKRSPFHLSLMEMKAWKLMEEGKKEEASALLVELHRDKTVAASMRNRVTLALQSIAPEKLEAAAGHE